MGVLGCCTTCCGLVVVVVAVFIGYLNTFEHPLGGIFVLIFKAQGIGKPATEPVPADLTPLLRPAGEIMLPLPGGDKMPASGIGMCCRPTAYDPVSVHRTILWYLMKGGRHIDTASMYMNHEAIGLGIKDAMARGVPRKEIFLTTKIMSDHFGYNASIERTRRMAVELGLDYIDLVLIHAPIIISPSAFAKFMYSYYVSAGDAEMRLGSDPEAVQLRLETWKGLSAVKEEGLVRNVGVSNFKIDHMKQIQDLGLAPIAAHQMQYHPWAPEWLQEVVQYCHKHNIVVTGYFTLGGFDKKDKMLDVAKIDEIAKAHGRRPAQILQRWSLQKNVSVIPGTGNPKHMVDNLEIYNFSLSDADMAKIDGMANDPIKKEFTFFDF